MAKFGIALGSGPRGLGFESRHSDQKEDRLAGRSSFILFYSKEIAMKGKDTVISILDILL